MTKITLYDSDCRINNLLYIKNSLSELFSHAGATAETSSADKRAKLSVEFPDYYEDIVRAEISDRLGEVIAVNYKYEYFKSLIKVSGLTATENEILLASLIAADLPEDAGYAAERFKDVRDTAIDGIFNFRLQPLKKKWKDVASYMPDVFMNSQLKDFISYLLENKKKRVYVDNGKVYDSHYRRLKRCELLSGNDAIIVREVILSNCGEVELAGKVDETDEKYLKEYYGDKIFFSTGYLT